MGEVIGFLIVAVGVVFFGLLALAGALILIVLFIGVPLAFIIRILTPDPLD